MPDIDTVVELIKTSNSRSEAKDKLRAHFDLSEKQADAILDMRLVNITKMEVTRIEKELADIKKSIAELEKIVGSKTEQLRVVKRELAEIRDKYRTKRLSIIVDNVEDIEHKPFQIESAEGKRGYVTLDCEGNVKFINPRQFMTADRENPTVASETSSALVYVDKNEQIIVFGSQGNCYRLDIAGMRESSWREKGENLFHIFPSAPMDEKGVALIKFDESNLDKDLYIFTRMGMVKRSPAKEYVVNKDMYQGTVLKDGDEVINVEFVQDDSNIVFVSDDGQCLNCEEDIPVQGRKAGGVIGMTLNDGANVKYVSQVATEDGEIIGEIALISDGYAKRVVASNVEPSKRARKGIKVIDTLGRGLLFVDFVTEECKISIVDKSGAVSTISSEDILIDRNKNGKGKPMPLSVGASYAVRQHFDV